MRIAQLNIGTPVLVERGGRRERTAIDRRPVDERVALDALGLEGDQVGSTKHHGGKDKAVCCYASEHYAHFEELLGCSLDKPAFGENFTLEGALETEVCIGDSFRVGSAVVQISQPRQPCATLAAKHDSTDLPGWINDTGFTGFYLRVLEPGEVRTGDELTPVDRPHPGMSVALANRIMLGREPDEAMHRLADLPTLSDAWRRRLESKINKRV
jgi:MOSC domain-containing protein YiiM